MHFISRKDIRLRELILALIWKRIKMAWVWERIRTSLKQLNFDHLERRRRREETEVEVAQEAEVSDLIFILFFIQFCVTFKYQPISRRGCYPPSDKAFNYSYPLNLTQPRLVEILCDHPWTLLRFSDLTGTGAFNAIVRLVLMRPLFQSI